MAKMLQLVSKAVKSLLLLLVIYYLSIFEEVLAGI
jgi:hypothetical protein